MTCPGTFPVGLRCCWISKGTEHLSAAAGPRVHPRRVTRREDSFTSHRQRHTLKAGCVSAIPRPFELLVVQAAAACVERLAAARMAFIAAMEV